MNPRRSRSRRKRFESVRGNLVGPAARYHSWRIQSPRRSCESRRNFSGRLTRLVVGLVVVLLLVSVAQSLFPPLDSGRRLLAAAVDPKDGSDDEREARMPLDGKDGRPLALDQFRPRSMLRVETHQPPGAKFPCVDVHTHPRFRLLHSKKRLDEFVKIMDEQNIAACVSLDGRLGAEFEEHAKYLWTQYRDRFVIFANVDWMGSGKPDDPASWDCQRTDFGRHTTEQLAEAKRMGASGLKFFKQFGLGYRNPDGSLIRIDDPRWDPIWEACGKLGLVVIIHTADPAAFFLPIDAHNERWEELHRHPDWSFYGEDFPSRDELLEARNRVIGRHPETTFIGAHMANNPEDLARVGEWLDQYPNLYIEIAARIAELGRQPYTARRFFLKYADRIMFGTDGPRSRARLLPHWRFLETFDENFPYAENPFPPQGLWNIFGIGLPDDVLRKVYYGNAMRVIPGISERVEKYRAAKRAG